MAETRRVKRAAGVEARKVKQAADAKVAAVEAKLKQAEEMVVAMKRDTAKGRR